ncbi:MAG: hypothetical protein KJ025_04850 [Burkholderiales bacterium]|nr:hypothetical protein [Burkholderiales bacterium]
MHSLTGIAWRTLWRSVAVLLVFVQVAAAADRCLIERLGAHDDALVGVAADVRHGLDAHCASDLVSTDQAPASEATRLAPAAGTTVPAAWSAAPDTSPLPAAYALARAGPSLLLQFRNLRL